MPGTQTADHRFPHNLSGFPVIYIRTASNSTNRKFPVGEEYTLVDWLDRMIGGKWVDLRGNNTLAGTYAKRYASGMKGRNIPQDNNVVVIKNAEGDLYPLHTSEIAPGEAGRG